MTMKNAQMEFVSFDALDVIASSGSVTSYVSGSIGYDSPSGENRCIDDHGIDIFIESDGSNWLILNNATDEGYNVFHICTIGISDKPTGNGYEELTTFDDILRWLVSIGVYNGE